MEGIPNICAQSEARGAKSMEHEKFLCRWCLTFLFYMSDFGIKGGSVVNTVGERIILCGSVGWFSCIALVHPSTDT